MKPNRDKSVLSLSKGIVNQICFDLLDGNRLTNKEVGQVLNQVNFEAREILLKRKEFLLKDFQETIESINRIHVDNPTKQN
jgi:hypothetical protein